MRYTGPKNRLARREGADLGLKTAGSKSQSNLLKRLNLVPGQHGHSRRRKTTDYGIQLREKQKLKRIYGITERQIKRYFDKASGKLGNTAEFLVSYLESRLDNTIYKSGFTPTRFSARQLVNHGHMLVNNRKVAIPSYQLKVGDVINFKKDKTTKIAYVQESLAKKDIIIPLWIQREGALVKIKSQPKREDFKENVNLQLVVEFYSR